MAAAGSFRLNVQGLIGGKNTHCVLTVASSDLVSAVLQESALQLELVASDWNLYKNEGRTDVLDPSTTLEFNGLKGNLKLFLGKVTCDAAS